MFCSTTAIVLAALASQASALIYGVDSSALISTSLYSTAASEGYTKAVIRGYQEACSVGGQVDPNFVGSYNDAVSAGITNIDAYWFPCNGSGHSCKSYDTQISELINVISSNALSIGTIWIDLEKDSVCNNFNYGASGNLAEAQSILSAAVATGYSFGIYSSPGEWSTLFGSQSVVLDTSFPLWFATYDNVQSLTLNNPFGGWTSAVGKQYTDQSASGQFDLNVFAY